MNCSVTKVIPMVMEQAQGDKGLLLDLFLPFISAFCSHSQLPVSEHLFVSLACFSFSPTRRLQTQPISLKALLAFKTFLSTAFIAEGHLRLMKDF